MREKLVNECIFKASLSSGAGGQHVNKVNTKVELRFNIDNSAYLSNEEKTILNAKLENRINNEGFLVMTSQSERSQIKNKEKVIERFLKLIEKSLQPEKERKPTKPSFSSKIKRLDLKKKQAEKKTRRKDVDLE